MLYTVAGKKFIRGSMSPRHELLPVQYESTYRRAHAAGYVYPGGTKDRASARMSLFGSTISASQTPRFLRPDGSGEYGMCPRQNTACRPGKAGAALLREPWLVAFAKEAEQHVLAYGEQCDPVCLAAMKLAKHIIPSDMRVCGTGFTAIAFVGDLEDSRNHEHLDSHDVISIFVQIGVDVAGGSTTYYSGERAMRKRDNTRHNYEARTRGELLHEVHHSHMQYQVGAFHEVLHAGEPWRGKRGVISLYLNKAILDHYRVHCDKFTARYGLDGKRMGPSLMLPPKRKAEECADSATKRQASGASADDAIEL